MKNLVKRTNQELDTCNALVVMSESEQSYENYTQNSEDTKVKGGLYKVEQKVVKKRKHNVRLEIPQNLPMRIMTIIATIGIALVIPRLTGIMGIATEEVIEDTGSIMGMSQARTSISDFYNLVCNIATIVSFVAAGLIFIALLKDMIKIEDAGEKEKIKEEVSEFKVPYPDEFYKQQITTEENSGQGTKDETETIKSSMLFVPFPDEIAKKEVV